MFVQMRVWPYRPHVSEPDDDGTIAQITETGHIHHLED